MTSKQGTASTKNYNVVGKTLEDINTDMMKKGPPDPNDKKRYSGSCLGELVLDIKSGDFDFATTDGSSPIEVTATLKGGTITCNTTTTMPKLASNKDLSDDAKKEWKRFISKVQVHEDGHADSYLKLAKAISDDLNTVSGKGTGKDERSAQAAAAKDLTGQISKKLSGTNSLSQQIKDDAKAYDAKTKHGQTQGAVLDASIT
jgi:predicted secreted Zn-dependent protease